MDNLKTPVYPCNSDLPGQPHVGFAKLELASLMIAQGRLHGGWIPESRVDFAKYCKELAQVILIEANR